MGRFEGRVALITGASRGIGRGIAICLAQEGADIVVHYRTHPEEAQEVADAVGALGQRALLWGADVADRSAIEAMVSGAAAHFGRNDQGLRAFAPDFAAFRIVGRLLVLNAGPVGMTCHRKLFRFVGRVR